MTRPQEPEHRGRVGDATARDHPQSLPERHLYHLYELRRFGTGTFGVAHGPAPEEVADLGGTPGAGVYRDEALELLGPEPGLLEELAPGGLTGVLAFVDPAARQLQREGSLEAGATGVRGPRRRRP